MLNDIKQKIKKKDDTLKATWDLLVFLILIALFTCLPGSSSKIDTYEKQDQPTENEI